MYGIEQDNDVVSLPGHYRQGGIECIEAIEASMTRAESSNFKIFCKSSIYQKSCINKRKCFHKR